MIGYGILYLEIRDIGVAKNVLNENNYQKVH